MKAPTPDDVEGSAHAENMTNSAKPSCLREGVGPTSRYAKAWALYFSKFLTACELQCVLPHVLDDFFQCLTRV